MLNELRTFLDHSRHSLSVRNVDARLDVLAFQGTEGLSNSSTTAWNLLALTVMSTPGKRSARTPVSVARCAAQLTLSGPECTQG